jgi:hypothetical protein
MVITLYDGSESLLSIGWSVKLLLKLASTVILGFRACQDFFSLDMCVFE